jgi:hypothetical protein
MPKATDVNPGKWSEIKVLFDDGTYSVVEGKYEGQPALGERWNGGANGHGFPNQGGNPLWHVVPQFLCRAVLHGVIDELSKVSPPNTGHLNNTLEALSRFR